MSDNNIRADPLDESRIAAGSSSESAGFFLPALRQWLLLVLLIGLAWRVGRWVLGMPLWGDEAMLGLNVLQRSFADLAKPLDYSQVAPVLFLWAQKGVISWMGAGDWAVRLLPTLASIAALLLFHRLAKYSLGLVPAAIATGFLAVAYYACRHGSEFKPYSVDLLASVVILSLTLDWLVRPSAWLTPILLILSLPVFIGVSHPAVFVAGGTGIVLAVEALHQRHRRMIFLSTVYLCVIAASFALFFFWVTRGQDQVTGPGLRAYWSDAFPPANPVRLFIWLLDVHTGNLFAYPVGGKRGGSTLTFLLVLTGLISLWRSRRQQFLLLLLLPFVLTFIAAAMHQYPYGVSARIAQHLAPAICLLAGCGTATLLDRIPEKVSWRAYAPTIVLIGLCVIGAAGLIADVVRPYKTLPDLEVRRVVDHAFNRQPDHRVVVLANPVNIPPNYLWYLKATHGNVEYQPAVIQSTGESISILTFSPDPSLIKSVEQSLDSQGSPMILREDMEHLLQIGPRELSPSYCRSLWWSTPHR